VGTGEGAGRVGGPTFGPARRVRSFDDVVEQVRRSIVEGVIAAGDRLPSEREMAEQFGVSRATLREALRALEALGLLEIRRGAQGGAFAVDATPERLIVQVRELLAVEAARNTADARAFRATFHSDNLRWMRVSDQVMGHLSASCRRGRHDFLVAVADATGVPMRRILAEAIEAVNQWSTGSTELEVAEMRRVIDLVQSDDRDAACDFLFQRLAGSEQIELLS
jgi:DNA-binding FadR family transcriptional regulator